MCHYHVLFKANKMSHWLYVSLCEQNFLKVLNKIFFWKKKVLLIVHSLKEMNKILWTSLPLYSGRSIWGILATLWNMMTWLSDHCWVSQQSPCIEYKEKQRQVSLQIKGKSQQERARSAFYVQIRNCLACSWLPCTGFVLE